MTDREVLISFESYLAERGYSTITPSGNHSTTYDYAHSRIPFVLKQEGIDIRILARYIDKYISVYDECGEKTHLGKKSHNAVINALKRFKEFLIDMNLYNRS